MDAPLQQYARLRGLSERTRLARDTPVAVCRRLQAGTLYLRWLA